jgi:uncharacterized damage-inducible protein DinB
MSNLPLWFERKFKFDFPVEVYPNLCTRLRGAPPRLEELLRGLTREQLVRQPEGKWSIQENAGHLLDLEPLWFARVDDFLAGKPELAPADLANRKTHEACHNSCFIVDLLAEFRRARIALVDRLETLRAGDFARSALHPRLKAPMRLVDHMYFIAEHDDHHLARIWELRRQG